LRFPETARRGKCIEYAENTDELSVANLTEFRGDLDVVKIDERVTVSAGRQSLSNSTSRTMIDGLSPSARVTVLAHAFRLA
jgi:hypothetical protein